MDAPRHEHAVERSPADIPDNRPLSGRIVGWPWPGVSQSRCGRWLQAPVGEAAMPW